MDYVIAWCGFVGAWLLFAGPLYQGALELRDEEIDNEGIEARATGVDQPKHPSAWWWLLPPVAYLITRRRQADYRRAVMHALTAEQRLQFVSFTNKATGWFIVAAGAVLIATKESWELLELNEWPGWVLAILLVAPAGLGLLHTVTRLNVSKKIVADELAEAR